MHLSPETSVLAQKAYRSDIIVPLDELPVGLDPNTYTRTPTPEPAGPTPEGFGHIYIYTRVRV